MSDFALPSKDKMQSNSKASTIDKKAEAAAGLSNEEQATTDTVDNAKEKPKYSPEELNEIFDQMLFSGEYSETVTIRGKLKVTFKTRDAKETADITRQLDNTTANLVSTLNEKQALLTLLKSLVSYHGKDLSKFKEEEKQNFLEKLPSPVIGALLSALQKFDTKVFEACKDAEENF